MSEKENEKKIAEDKTEATRNETTNELKQETVNTVKQVKDTVKNVNFREETKKTQGLFTELFKKPIATLKNIANDNKNSFFKTALFIFIIWTVIAIIDALCTKFSGYYGWYISFKSVGRDILGFIKILVAPVLSIIVLSLAIFIMNKKSKKSLVTIITTVIATKIPVVIGELVSLLVYISSNASMITSPFARFCNVISVVLAYFGIKELLAEKEDGKFIKIFVIIQGIYFLAAFVINFLGIRI